MQSYDNAVGESKQMVSLLRDLVMGRTRKLEEYMDVQMQSAIERENYERAAKLRDMIYQLQAVSEKQSIVFDTDIS